MGGIIKAIVNTIKTIVQAVIDVIVAVIEFVWEELLEPALEEIFSWFGIEGETVVQAEKISSKILGESTPEAIRKSQVKAIIEYVNTPQAFFPCYMGTMGQAREQVLSYYRYGERVYTHGLPVLSVSGTSIDATDVKLAVDTDLSIANSSIISSVYRSIPFAVSWKYYLQSSYAYKPGLNEILYPDSWGNTRTWKVQSCVDVSTAYTVTLIRESEKVYLWMYGNSSVVEGSSTEYTIYSSNAVPIGKSLPINLTYTGTAVDGVDYTSVAQVVMLATTNSVSFTIDTIDNADAHVARSFTVTASSVDNSTDVFDDPIILQPLESVSTAITDDEGVILTMPFLTVDESFASVSIPVTLENEAPLKLIQTDTFTEGVEYNNPGPDISLTLTVTPEDPSYLVITFDGAVNTDWTLLDAVVTFTVDIPVGTLVIVAETSSRAFTVDYEFADGTAVGLIGGGAGSDYDSTTGSLSFVGTAGEVQNIVVPVTADVVADDQENFTVSLVNCSDPAVTLTSTTITLWDGTDAVVSDFQTDTTTFDIAPIANTTRMVVKYHTGNENDWYYWLYDVVTNAYPDVVAKEQVLSDMQMMPVVILRRDKVNIKDAVLDEEGVEISPADEAYHSSKMLMETLRMSLKDILKNIGTENQADVDDAYLNFSVSPSDDNRIVSKIIFRTFHFLHVGNNLTSSTGSYRALFEEADVQNGIVWTGFEWTEDKVGALGIPIGEYTHSRVAAIPGVPAVLDPYGAVTTPEVPEVPSRLVLQYRKSETAYDELVILSLAGLYTIKYAGFSKVVTKKMTDEAFTIPVSYYIIKDLNYLELLEGYGYMLRIDFNALTITELEWYQTEAFMKLFNFVMLVINIVSLGTAAPLTILLTLATQYVIYRIVVFVAELTGNAVLAAVVGIVAGALLGGVKIDLSTFMDAESLLAITTDFATNLGAGMGVVMEDMAADMAKFTEDYKKVNERLEEAEKDQEQDLDAQFLIALQSVNTNMYKAIQNQYDYDTIYNETQRTVSDFVDSKLRASQVV